MKKICHTLLAVVIIGSVTGCATPYMMDRKRDAADIFTFRTGVGVGAKVHIGPIQEGLLFNFDCLGLRGGEIVWRNKVPNTGADFDYLLGGYTEFDTRPFNPDSVAWKRGKCYRLAYDIFGIPVNTPFRCPVPNRYSPSYFTDIEVVGGLLWTFRVGFNPGELLDFVLGWSAIDIFKDDIEAKKKSDKANQAPQTIGTEASPQPGR